MYIYNRHFNVQLLQLHLSCVFVLRAQPQRAAAHPAQRIQARGCIRARRRVRHGVLLHVGLRERASRIALSAICAPLSFHYMQLQ